MVLALAWVGLGLLGKQSIHPPTVGLGHKDCDSALRISSLGICLGNGSWPVAMGLAAFLCQEAQHLSTAAAIPKCEGQVNLSFYLSSHRQGNCPISISAAVIKKTTLTKRILEEKEIYFSVRFQVTAHPSSLRSFKQLDTHSGERRAMHLLSLTCSPVHGSISPL